MEGGNLCFYACLKSPTIVMFLSGNICIQHVADSYTFDVSRFEDVWLRLVFPVETPENELRISIKNSRLVDLVGKSKSGDGGHVSDLARKSEPDNGDVIGLARNSEGANGRSSVAGSQDLR